MSDHSHSSADDVAARVDRLKERGNALHNEGRWGEAAALYSEALRDGKELLKIAPTWTKAYTRIGVALHGLRFYEEAYVTYSRGLSKCAGHGDTKDIQAARVLSLQKFAEGESNRDAARQKRFYSKDAHRSRNDLRIFCASDLHVDIRGNIEWCKAISRTLFQNDVLIVAGDVADTASGVRVALSELKARFRRVFYMPGNHDLWVRPGLEQYPDSICKLIALLDMCGELGVETAPAEVAEGIFVVPLFSWYSSTFDEADPQPGDLRYDKFCSWPCREEQVWQFMLSLNRRRVATKYKRKPGDKCFTFSHFLPHTALPFSRGVPELAKAVGCKELDAHVRAVQSDVHVYGHSHINIDTAVMSSSSSRLASLAGAGSLRYVQHALEAAGQSSPPYCIWENGKDAAHGAAAWR